MQAPARMALIVTVLASVAPISTAAEILEIDGCRGTGVLEVHAGDPARGLPHWDPVEQVLRDRLTLHPRAPLGAVRPVLLDAGEGVEARILPLAQPPARTVRGGLPSRLVLQDGGGLAHQVFARASDGWAPDLEIGFGESCATPVPYTYVAGHDGGYLPTGEPVEAPDLMPAASIGEGPVLFRYDQLWPAVFVGSASGWYWAGNRFTVGFPIELLEVQFMVSAAGRGAGYQVFLFYVPEVTTDLPWIGDAVYVGNGTIPTTGEGPLVLVKHSLVEAGLRFEPGTLWVGVRNLEGQSMALAVDAAYDHQGNSFASTSNGEMFWAFGVTGPGDGRPMVRALVQPLRPAPGPDLPTPSISLPGGDGF